MNEEELISLNLYQHGFSLREIESITGVSRRHLSKIFTEFGYSVTNKVILDENSVIAMYESGSSLVNVGEKYGVAPSTIHRILKKHSVKTRKRVIELPEQEVIYNYTSRTSLNHWARHYKVDSSVIKRILTENNIDIASQSEAQRTYKYNHNIFQDIDTEDKAYWLGFIFADGCVYSNRDSISIRLADKDIKHVQKFANFIDYSSELDSPAISLRSKKMKSDLIYHGCLPRKSFIDVIPYDVPDELRRHFARGVCDGDGYVGVYEKSASIEIVGGRTLLSWLSENGLSGDVRPHKSIWRLRSKTSNVLQWGRFMYQDSSIYLDRKYNSYLRMESVLGGK